MSLCQEPSYQGGMPTPLDVLEKINGKDELNTLAKQGAVFERLSAIMLDVFSMAQLKKLKASKNDIRHDYHIFYETLHKKFLQNASEAEWCKLFGTYLRDDDFQLQEEVVNKLLRGQIKSDYSEILAGKEKYQEVIKIKQDNEDAVKQQAYNAVLKEGIIELVIGITAFVLAIYLFRNARVPGLAFIILLVGFFTICTGIDELWKLF